MAQTFAESLSWVPKSRQLSATLARAHDLARAQGHQRVTLEHTLLALVEDSDAASVLRASSVDLAGLTSLVSNFVARLPGGAQGEPEAGPDLVRILEYAVAAAQQSRRREVNGAIVLAAIVGEGKSEAANQLRAHGLTFEVAIQALQQTGGGPRTQPPAASAPAGAGAPQQLAPQPAPAPTEEILAAARRRVDASRSQSSGAGRGAAGEAALDAVAASGWAPPPPATQAPAPAARNQRLPPPIPATASAPPAAMTARSGGSDSDIWALVRGNGEGHARDAGRFRSAGAPWSEAANPAGVGQGEAPTSAAYNYLTADVPYPDPDALTTARAAGKSGQGGRAAATTGGALVPFDGAHMADVLPRRLRAGAASTIEVTVARAEVAAIGAGLDARGALHHNDQVISNVMTVRLKAPDGGFWIEPASPEAQWIDMKTAALSDEVASWRWSVTPKGRGKKRLQLVMSARSVGADGSMAETALPDQGVDVRVRSNIRNLLTWLVIIAISAGVGAVLDDPVWAVVTDLFGAVRKVAGL